MRRLTVTINIEITDQFLSDILTTAMEGGVGYWLRVGKVHRALQDNESQLEEMSIYRVNDPRDADSNEEFDMANFMPGFEVNRNHDITLNHVFRGLQRLFEPNVLPHRDDIRREVQRPDDADIDSDAADVILQLGFFGEVVFG